MASAASSIVRRFARAARSAAATTSRITRLAERAALSTKAVVTESHAPSLGLGCAASGDLPSAVSASCPAMAAPASLPFSYLKDQRMEGRVKFMVQDKDLESEEALRALYERWCKAFNQKRDPDEMVSCFNKFKETVQNVHRKNKTDLPYKLGLNRFADGKLRKPPCRDPFHFEVVEQFGNNPVEFISYGGKRYRRVFTDYQIIDGRLYLDLPKGVDLQTITTDPESLV